VGLFQPHEALTPWELVNSVMIRPHPLRWRMKRRNTVSVTPAMGARTVAGATRTGPIVSVDGKTLVIPVSFHSSMLETKGAEAASKKAKEQRMKIIQAAVLVLVGALGAMLYLKVKSGPETPAPAAQAAPAQPAAPATPPEPVAAPVVAPAAPAPVRTA